MMKTIENKNKMVNECKSTQFTSAYHICVFIERLNIDQQHFFFELFFLYLSYFVVVV